MAFLEEFDYYTVETVEGSHQVSVKRTISQMLDSAEEHWRQAEAEIVKQRRSECEAVSARQKAEKALKDDKTIEELKKQLSDANKKYTSKENKLLSMCFLSSIPFYIMTYTVMYMYMFNGMPNTSLGKFTFLGCGLCFVLFTSFVTAAFFTPLLMGEHND